MTAHLYRGDDFTALTISDQSGATLNVERTDDDTLSAWIAPPGGNDGHSVSLDGPDLTALVAYVSAGVSQDGLVEPSGVTDADVDRYAHFVVGHPDAEPDDRHRAAVRAVLDGLAQDGRLLAGKAVTVDA